MKTATEETDSPVEEGSLFKWGNLNEPIDASSNKHEKEYWIEVQPKDFKDDKAKPLKIADTNNGMAGFIFCTCTIESNFEINY